MTDVTRMLLRTDSGDPTAAEQLLPLVYDELRRLAASRLSQENSGQTLQATALVHEAYLRLVNVNQPQHWNDRAHFFGAAAEAMRRILIENARRKRGLKHGGGYRRVDWDDAVRRVAEEPDAALIDDVIALDEALEKFAQEDPRKAALVKLRYFAGLSVQEAGEMLGISRATADRYWAYAKVWLYDYLSGPSRPETK